MEPSGRTSLSTLQFHSATPWRDNIMAEKMDAIALLKADHRKVEDLFGKFEKARSKEIKKSLVQQICTELSIHAIIEEEIFYPACTGEVEDDLIHEAYVE